MTKQEFNKLSEFIGEFGKPNKFHVQINRSKDRPAFEMRLISLTEEPHSKCNAYWLLEFPEEIEK